MKTLVFLTFLLTLLAASIAAATAEGDSAAVDEPPVLASSAVQPLTPLERLGRRLFFDTNLSRPAGQSCASCHDPNFAFTDPNKSFPTSQGAVTGLFGKRNTPTVMYSHADVNPKLHYDQDLQAWVGGQFWDGRVNTLEGQAQRPFLSAVEMGNPSPAAVVRKVRNSSYRWLFEAVFGVNALDDPKVAFDNIAVAIAAFERTARFGQFTSKFDAVRAGNANAVLTEQEFLGQSLYFQIGCASCHPLSGAGGVALPGTAFSYHNLGVPKNPQNPFYRMGETINPEGTNFVDTGLGGRFPADSTRRARQLGKFKTPTVRNIALTAPYGHNGYFNTLRGIVDFYNTRDVKPRCKNKAGEAITLGEAAALKRGCWPAPEVSAHVDRVVRGGAAMGDMGLSPGDVDAIVAFLQTLTDGWKPN